MRAADRTPQYTRCPHTKMGRSFTVHPIADSDDGVEVAVFRLVLLPSLAVISIDNCLEKVLRHQIFLNAVKHCHGTVEISDSVFCVNGWSHCANISTLRLSRVNKILRDRLLGRLWLSSFFHLPLYHFRKGNCKENQTKQNTF